MLRKLAGASLVVFVVGGILVAGEYKGRLKSIDTDKMTITVATKKDEEKVLKYNDKTEFAVGKKGATVAAEKLAKIVSKAKKGVNVIVTTEGEGDKEVVTKVSIRRKKRKAE
jgi:hypothetical protein